MSALRRGAPATRVELRIEEPKWRSADKALLQRAARVALLAAQRTGTLTVLLTTDEQLCALNARFRKKPKPTNVLSFPSSSPSDGYLGDIALAFGVAEHEAVASKKSLSEHAAHLVVHGVLHLLGYDHESAREARAMEGLEVTILKEMGIGNPYAISTKAG